jgi:hypothetical protein
VLGERAMALHSFEVADEGDVGGDTNRAV